MAQMEKWGYRYGRSEIRRFAVGNASAISAGDILTREGSGDYLVTRASAGSNTVVGVALESCAAPTTDADVYIEVEVSTDAVHEYPIAAGTAAVTLINKTCDVGGAQSIDAAASADDIVRIIDVDTRRNTLLVKFDTKVGWSGVV